MAKYTPQLAEQIAETVGGGTPIIVAAQAFGINKSTYRLWLEKYTEFRNLVETKRAQAIKERVDRIKAAGVKGTWTADAWWLERQQPDEFGAKPEKKDISINLTIRDCTMDRDPRLEPDLEPVTLLECKAIDQSSQTPPPHGEGRGDRRPLTSDEFGAGESGTM